MKKLDAEMEVLGLCWLAWFIMVVVCNTFLCLVIGARLLNNFNFEELIILTLGSFLEFLLIYASIKFLREKDETQTN